MKLRLLLLTLLLAAIALTIFTYRTNVVSTEYPSCGGGYFTAPTGPGVYNLPCIAADRPTIYVRDNTKLYAASGLLVGLLAINVVTYAKNRKKIRS